MDIKGDTISHTSDYFDQIYELAIKLIEANKAYTDDTEQAQVSTLGNVFIVADIQVDARGTGQRNCFGTSR